MVTADFIIEKLQSVYFIVRYLYKVHKMKACLSVRVANLRKYWTDLD
jgi:hypothetical protein